MTKYLVLLLLVGCSKSPIAGSSSDYDANHCSEPVIALMVGPHDAGSVDVDKQVCIKSVKEDPCEKLSTNCNKFLDEVKCEAVKASCIKSEKKYQCNKKCSPLFRRCGYDIGNGDLHMCDEMMCACEKSCMEE